MGAEAGLSMLEWPAADNTGVCILTQTDTRKSAT